MSDDEKLKVLVYPHLPRHTQYEDVFEKSDLSDRYKIVYIVNKSSIKEIDVDYYIAKFEDIIEAAGLENVEFVAMGYSPMVAVCYYIASSFGVRTVFFQKDNEGNLEKEYVPDVISNKMFKTKMSIAIEKKEKGGDN